MAKSLLILTAADPKPKAKPQGLDYYGEDDYQYGYDDYGNYGDGEGG